MGQKDDSDLLNPTPPKAKGRRGRQAVLSVVVAAIAAVGTGLAFTYLTSSPTGAAQAPSLDTWQQWGMSMPYPSGLKPQYQGVLEQQASNSSGEVGWVWNKAQTSLYLTWVTTPTYNLSAGFAAFRDKVQAETTNLTLIGSGNTTMSGHSWMYQTYSFKSNGVQDYVTVALTYYQNSQRAYILFFQDTSSGTLSALTYYGNKFSG